VRLKRDGTRAETRFRLSPKRTSPFKSAGASIQSTTGSRGVRISVSKAGYTTFRGSMTVLATHSSRQFPLHFPSRASPCAIRFQTHSTYSRSASSGLPSGDLTYYLPFHGRSVIHFFLSRLLLRYASTV
jgi:hypothetical protein